MRIGFEEKIVDAVARIAAGLLEPEDYSVTLLADHVVDSIRIVGTRLRPRSSTIYCALCGRGPFTRKGYYLHLVRVHYSEILHLVREEAERAGRASKL